MSDFGKSAADLMSGLDAPKPTAKELREAQQREAAAEREQLKVGSIWQENDPRQERYIRVERIGADDVVIRGVLLDGTRYKGSRETRSRKDRFGGSRRGNYSFVREI